jgi:uncharacterized protein (DUF4415 family)
VRAGRPYPSKSAIPQQDWDEAEIPEWTAEDAAKAVPFQQAHPEAFDAWKRGPGRPKSDDAKLSLNMRMDRNVVLGIKNSGKGYTRRVEKVLQEALAQGKI